MATTCNPAPEGWEYRSWPLYGVCMGCGAAYASMHAVGCSRPGRSEVRVVLASEVVASKEEQ